MLKPAEIVVHADTVCIAAVPSGTHDRIVMCLPGHQGQQFADVQTRYAGGDRFELAAVAFIGVRFWIERFLLCRASRRKQQDAVLGSRGLGLWIA